MISLIDFAGNIYRYLIIGYILLSWFPHARESFVGSLLSKAVEPYLSIFRRFIPPLGMIDLSPIAALFALYFVINGVKGILRFLVPGL